VRYPNDLQGINIWNSKDTLDCFYSVGK